MRGKYDVGDDPLCYPGTDLLINKLNIKNEQDFEQAEAAFFTARYADPTLPSPPTSITGFTLEHWQRLHWHLFQDVYIWAGQLRQCSISKGETRFCAWDRIIAESEKQFALLHGHKLDSSREIAVTSLTELYSELNIVHPFREGNGRSQRLLFEQIAFVMGYELEWPILTQSEWLQANIKAYQCDLSSLYTIFDAALRSNR